MDDFIRQWLDQPDRDPKQLSEHILTNDRWDRKYFDGMLSDVDDFMINHERLVQKVETGSPMWADLFWLLWKVEPNLMESGKVRPSHLINYLVGEEMLDLKEFQRLKYFAEGDDVAAAMAAIDLRETLEQLFDKMKQLKDQLQKIMQQMQGLAKLDEEKHDIDQMVEQWAAGFNPDDPQEGQQEQGENLQQQQQQIDQAIKDLEQELQDQSQDLEEEAHAARAVIAQDLKKGMEEAADNASSVHAQQDMWGTETGAVMRLPADERMKLARQLQDRRFKHLLDLIGPMRRIMENAQMRRVDHARDEVFSITLGDDISRVLPSELVKLHHPVARKEFKRKLVEKELPQYELRGKEKVGRGEIIACLDNSGSMWGQKEMWGKAVVGCALHLARKQKRGFYGLHFGSARELMDFDFGLEADFSPQKVIDYMEFFFGGGTDFMRPLSAALDRLRDEYARTGKVKGDIMFITDGICGVDDSWLKMFKEEQARLEFKVWGFLIGGMGRTAEPLWSICDGNVFEVKDLLDPSSTERMWGEI